MVPSVDSIWFVYVVSTLFGLLLAALLWKHRHRTGAIPLLGNVLSGTLWSASLAGLELVDRPSLVSLLNGAVFLGVGLATLTLLVFTLTYTGRERYVTRRTLAALSIQPALITVLAAVNPAGLFFETTEAGVETGVLFWIHLGYSYLMLALVTAMIVGFLFRTRSLYRGQSAALLVGTLVAWVANGVFVVGYVDFDTSPIGFVVTSVLYTVAILRYRLTDIVPVARDRVVDTVSDAIFVIDERDRVIDANPVGRSLLSAYDASPIGKSIGSLFADAPKLLESYRDLTATVESDGRELEVDGTYYDVSVTPIDDDRDRYIGWLVIVRDITERKRNEVRLRRQNERLERFADVVSHDLRNPLNVADGYLDLARERDDPEPYLDEVDESLDRMEAIIEDVLALARHGADVTDPEPVSIADLAETAWETVDTGGATLRVASDATVLADGDRVTRLFENLFRNAVEHGSTTPTSNAQQDAVEHGSTSPDSLTVEVGAIDATEDDGETGFYVADDGRGLPDGADVFEDGYTTNADGTGFGLSIVRGIAAAHGWTATATESEAGGARFEFTGVEATPDADNEAAPSASDRPESATDATSS
ncbi:histidine kinase N-terminal 7TM domain-containing protein [Natrinema sp. CGMCC1.2065]|uniref:histidine kinase N-terminal 7TM domain-containing protein n=1 Tax=Natrinema sp. CGMCC1.2065 TaxID=3445767 RepID=UPI003F49FE8E